MATNEFDGSNIMVDPFQSSLRDSPVVVKQPGVETPGYYQHAPPGHCSIVSDEIEGISQANGGPPAQTSEPLAIPPSPQISSLESSFRLLILAT